VTQGHHESSRTVRIPNRVRTSNSSSSHESHVWGLPFDPTADLRTHYATMASPPSFGLGGSTNHSLRDVRLAEPGQEVDRPIASQGIENNRNI